MTKALALLILFTVQGCVVGHSEFQCSEGSENGICASASTIYRATNDELKENETLTYFKDGEVYQTTLQALQMARKNNEQVSKQDLSMIDVDKSAIRIAPSIMRIWIAPWVSKDDVLSMGKFIFTDMQSKQWKYGKEQTSTNYYQPAFKANKN